MIYLTPNSLKQITNATNAFGLYRDEWQLHVICTFTGRIHMVVMMVIGIRCIHPTLEKTNKPCHIEVMMTNYATVHIMPYLEH